jgi:hypothetical protein
MEDAMDELIEAIGTSAIGTMMGESPFAFPLAETVHVMAITTVVGLITIVDLRLMGVASLDYAISRLSRALLPASWIAFGIALVSGLLLFSSQPMVYVNNLAFRMKLLFIAAAGLNMLVFHFISMRDIAAWDRNRPIPLKGRLAGALSLLIWVLVVAFGRWVGFTMSRF